MILLLLRGWPSSPPARTASCSLTCSLVSATVWPQEENTARGSGFKYFWTVSYRYSWEERAEVGLWELSGSGLAWRGESVHGCTRRKISTRIVSYKTCPYLCRHITHKSVYSHTCTHKLNKHVSFCTVYHVIIRVIIEIFGGHCTVQYIDAILKMQCDTCHVKIHASEWCYWWPLYVWIWCQYCTTFTGCAIDVTHRKVSKEKKTQTIMRPAAIVVTFSQRFDEFIFVVTCWIHSAAPIGAIKYCFIFVCSSYSHFFFSFLRRSGNKNAYELHFVCVYEHVTFITDNNITTVSPPSQPNILTTLKCCVWSGLLLCVCVWVY